MKKNILLEGLKTALQTELNGIHFYKMAADKTTDKKGKEVFLMLAEDEKKHFKELQKQYESIQKTNEWSPLSLGDIKNMFTGKSPIFSTEFQTRIKEKHFEMSALSIGALLENDSIDYYRKMKETVADPIPKKLFEKLQKWEQKHLEAITQQLEVLKHDYWAEQHFTPLF